MELKNMATNMAITHELESALQNQPKKYQPEKCS